VSTVNALLLFDIDGTLIDTEGAGLSALRLGFLEAFPERAPEPFPALDLAGATDGGVVRHLFEHFGIENLPSSRERFFRCYELALGERLRLHRSEGRGRLLPGVGGLLSRLEALKEAGTLLGLLTGNTAAGARTKLAHFGIEGHFGFGAFGDDDADRNALGPIAMERARLATGRPIAVERTVVVGDTPKDIACARACGARVVAVATGTCSRETLAAARPDALLDDFSDPECFFAALERLM